MEWILLFLLIILCASLLYNNASSSVCMIGLGVYTGLYLLYGYSFTCKLILVIFYSVICLFLICLPLRRKWVTLPIFKLYKKLKPKMSDTEKAALCAGDVGWTSEIFSARPDWNKLANMPYHILTDEELSFINNEVETLCDMVDNWEISKTLTIPETVWAYLRENRFFSMIIPKEYGGLAFSALAQSTVISKLASKSSSVATVVCVPNSLGPGELLMHHGTEKQKQYYLPRLARGEELPCFALTSPTAGSDAASIVDSGIIFQAEFEGKSQLCIKLNWDKRYITLAPVATLMGLAFKLYDPDHLLGAKDFIGITCALIPTDTPNIDIGRRHLPCGSAFPNGPIQGRDVIIPLNWVIGGAEMVGQGWQMLMSCLAAGRGVSLPSSSAGSMAKIMLTSSAYSRIRSQFNTPIGNFEGVQEALVKIVGYTYLSQALRIFTASHIDEGLSPVVASAIAKYNSTEYGRCVINSAFDLHGGKAICLGPKNYLNGDYLNSPIGITVEGANILTRSMIVFGQGAVRCHPYVLSEIMAADEVDSKVGLVKFDRSFWSHFGFIISNHFRSFFLGLTNAYFVRVRRKKSMRRYYQLATRFSTILALVSDVAMISLGSDLKRKECLSGRLADMVSILYIVTAVLKFYEHASKHAEDEDDLNVAKWVCIDQFKKFEQVLHEFLVNLPNRWVGRYLRLFCLPLGRFLNSPTDHLMRKISRSVMAPSRLRDRFKQYAAGYSSDSSIVSQIESALESLVNNEPLEKKIYQAKKEGLISEGLFDDVLDDALAKGVLTEEEKLALKAMDDLRMNIVNVDDFSEDEIARG